jgi:uncharacterized membrane protein
MEKGTSLRMPLVVLGVLLVAALIQLVAFLPLLPERLASHFDGSGRANGWSSRTAFFAIELVVLLMIVLFFVALPASFRRLPDSMINLPRKRYWLAPERRDESLGFLIASLNWFGCACLALIVAVTHLVIRVNLGLDPLLPSGMMWGLLLTFFGFTVVWLLRLLLHFRNG